MKKSLTDLLIGQKGKIAIDEHAQVPSKYIELGLTPGTVVELKSKAPFGGPIGIKLNENKVLIAIRRQDAKTVMIEKI
ncbi:ferrous iron transport protein A [Vaginella massiliensis]|uniref:FeoA family protein n=1 Tax=Vaginella massiliensis TaxID=1816680 RepID=UPI0008391174|nr:FeoA family protein [Vaginella massiliensis]